MKALRHYGLALWLALLCPLLGQAVVLSANEAFQVSLHPDYPSQLLVVDFRIAPDHYLYRERLHIISQPNSSISSIVMPESKHSIIDHEQKSHTVYTDTARIKLNLTSANNLPFELKLNYQGCAKSGLCYPPIQKNYHINWQAQQINVMTTGQSASATSALPQQIQLLHNLEQRNLLYTLVSFFILGLLLAFTPCVLPMIPILSGLITQHGKSITTAKAFRLSLVYVLSMALTYAIIGLLFGLIGQRIQASLQSVVMISLGSALLAALALSLFGLYDLQLPAWLRNKLAHLSRQQQGGNYLGVAAMGILATLVISPCVSAPLVAALGYISQTGNAVVGGSALFSLGLGMGFPLLIIGTSAGRWLPRTGHWMHVIKVLFGVMLLAMAIWLLSRIIPANIALALWAALVIICAVYMGALDAATQGWAKFFKGLGIIFLIQGTLLLIAVNLGSSSLRHPFTSLSFTTGNSLTNHVSFKTIHNLDQLTQALQTNHGRWTMLDFYADWCVSCQIMEKEIFTQPAVQAQLKQLQLLRVDVTHNTAADHVLLDHFRVIAPPTLIFFAPDGKPVADKRLVGEISAKKLVAHLRNL